MIIAWIVFGETLTLNGLMGLGVTSMGFWLIYWGEGQQIPR